MGAVLREGGNDRAEREGKVMLRTRGQEESRVVDRQHGERAADGKEHRHSCRSRRDQRANEKCEMEHVEGALNFLRKPDPVSKPRLSSFAFGPWSNWSNCSENCGIGEKSRTRKCTANGKVSCPADGTCNDDACVYESKQCEIKKWK